MAIDARIALGVQPVQQQPNMLAQYAQVMGIKAAQQEMEGNNALREAYASGGDLNDPAFRQRVMAANPKVGSQLIKTNAETGKLQNEAVLKRIELSREMLTGVNTPEDYLAWHESNHKDPVLGGYLNQRGVTAEQSRAKIIAALNTPGGLEKLKRESALGATALQKELMQTERSVQTANISAGPAYGQLALAREKAAREQQELSLIRGILTGNETTSAAPPVAGNAPMGGGVNVGGGGGTPAETRSSIFVNPASNNVLATQVAPQVTPAPNVNALNPNAMSRVDEIKQQITRLAKVGGQVANQAMEGLVKEYNVLNPAGKIEIDSTGALRIIDERSGTSRVVTGADGQPVMGKVAPVTKDVLDPTDPTEKRMITVDANTYVQGTGLGADGKGAAPKGVLGVAGSPLQPNYMRDPKNPQGVIPIPGSPADPSANLQIGYRQKADGTGQEFIPGGPADPKVQAAQNRVKLSEKDVAAREAKYPQATSALKSFNAKTDKFDRDITELLENKKGLDEITGFFAGRTDISAMSKEARRALALFNTITAKGGFSELQDMRNASPTGGALGNVSNQEGGQLIASFGALSRTQNGDDVRKSLETARSDLRNLKERMGEAYDLTYEYRNGGGGAPALPPGFKAD
jgi:hypothetical protein